MTLESKFLSSLSIAEFNNGCLSIATSIITAEGVEYPEVVLNDMEAEALRDFLNELLPIEA